MIFQKYNIKFYLSDPFFDKPEIINLLPEIIDQSLFLNSEKRFVSKKTGQPNNRGWAFDLRIPFSNLKYTKVLFPIIADYLNQYNCETLAFKGYGSFPFISITSYLSGANNILILREGKKSYGFQNEIEGIANKQSPVCIIDDLMQRGNSKRETMLILKNHGYEVNLIFTFLYIQRPNAIKTNKMLSVITGIPN